MQYIVEIKLIGREEPASNRYSDEDGQTRLGLKKLVEADTEKQAIQKVVDLITEGGK